MPFEPRKSLIRFRVNGKQVTLIDQSKGGKRSQRLCLDDEMIGIVESDRGSDKVEYTLTGWDKPRFKYVGSGGRTKEVLMRECRRILIREANAAGYGR